MDVPKDARQDLNIRFVENMQQVIDLVLLPPPEGERRLDRIRREREKEEQEEES